ncbi:MAG: hypothetical protein Q9157_001411 [Trypethelium eluteriae]
MDKKFFDQRLYGSNTNGTSDIQSYWSTVYLGYRDDLLHALSSLSWPLEKQDLAGMDSWSDFWLAGAAYRWNIGRQVEVKMGSA